MESSAIGKLLESILARRNGLIWIDVVEGNTRKPEKILALDCKPVAVCDVGCPQEQRATCLHKILRFLYTIGIALNVRGCLTNNLANFDTLLRQKAQQAL